MKYVKLLVSIVIIVGVLPACDDDPVMDLIFPQPGYLWIVFNEYRTPDEGEADIQKWTFPFESPEEFISMPFCSSGNAHEAACGDGKVWVIAKVWYGDEMKYEIWEAISDERVEIGRRCGGLTYDGELLWGSQTTIHAINTITNFFIINPVNYSFIDKFTYSTTTDEVLLGLAWSNVGLWSVFVKSPPPYGQPEDSSEFILFDPETGEDIYHIDSIIEYPTGLAWDGEALWTNDSETGRTYRIDPKNGETLGYVDLYNRHCYPYGLCFEATAAR